MQCFILRRDDFKKSSCFDYLITGLGCPENHTEDFDSVEFKSNNDLTNAKVEFVK